MGECGNHAENLRSLNEMPMDLLRLSLGQTTWVYFVCIRHGYSPCNVQNPHEGYLRPEWPKIPQTLSPPIDVWFEIEFTPIDGADSEI